MYIARPNYPDNTEQADPTLELRTAYMKKNDIHTQVCLRISRFFNS
jgi:hypothetical protein